MTKRKRKSRPQYGPPASRPQRGTPIAECGFREQCRLREVLLGIGDDELRVALAHVDKELLSPILTNMGIRPNLGTERGRQVFRNRLRRIPQEIQHYTLAVFADEPIADIARKFGLDRDDEEAMADLDVHGLMRDAGLRILAEHWPPGIAPIVLEVLWDIGNLTTEQRDDLLRAAEEDVSSAVLAPEDHSAASNTTSAVSPAPASHAGTRTEGASPVVMPGGFKNDEKRSEVCGDDRARDRALQEAAEEPGLLNSVSTAAPVAGRTVVQPSGGAPLDSLLAHAVDIAEATLATGSDLQRLTAALECVLALDPSRIDLWHHYGRVVAMWAVDTATAATIPPALPEARLELLRGQLHTLAVRGDQDRVWEIVSAHRGEAEQVLRLNTGPVGAEVSGDPVPAAILTAYLREPRQAARLLQIITGPFGSWPQFMRSARIRSSDLIATGDAIEAEILLRAVEATLWEWAARPDRPGRGLEREATEVALLRAVCRRHRRDFAGALKLLEGIERDNELLDVTGRAVASRETGLAIAEVAGLGAIAFARRDAERGQLRERLARARPHLEAALEGDAGADHPHLIATVLLGLLAVYEDDDVAAADYLGAAGPVLAEQPAAGELARAVRFHAALARLRLLEPGTDEAAFHEMSAAIACGYSPADIYLLSAAEALEAHGSPHAGAFLAEAASSAPNAIGLIELLADQARRGDPVAAAAAEERAGDSRLSLATRYMLLDAVLDWAGPTNDIAAAGRLADAIDEVLIRAGDRSLDERWAESLATNEALRLALEPAHADTELLEVLRRVGRVDEARVIAKSLFFRAANGTLRGFDAGDLAGLLAELGTPEAELADLERLVHQASDSQPTHADQLRAPVRVIFVGGTPVQEHYIPHLEALFAERYRGLVQVDWFMTGWGTNWGRAAERIEIAYEQANVVVVMTFVRTNLGRWTRRTAGEHGLPWLSCTGHGRASLERAIDRAVAVAVEQATLGQREPRSLA